MKSKLNRRQCLQRMGSVPLLTLFGMGWCRSGISETKTPGYTYHIDPVSGDDGNDGLTPARPLKTYAGRKFTGGDSILFKRGSVIRDRLYTCNGTEKYPIVYGAYGDGPKPAFLGSIAIGIGDKWTEEHPSIWRYTDPLPSEVCNLVFNNGSSCGILRWQREDLRKPGEWHYTGFGKQDQGGDSLYLCSLTNPGLAYDGIECVLWGGRKLAGGECHIILENLSFQNSGVHGYQEFHTRNIIIRNCDFRFIGGAVWNRERRIRFGNAIELWDGANDIRVEGCRFDNIYDSGVTHQGGGTQHIPERLFFRNNLFTNIGLAAYESREPAQEVYFEYNTCINAGSGFSMQGETPPRRSDPYPQPLGYHVWAWMIDPGTQPGNIYIRHNILCESFGPAACLSIAPADAGKFMLDYNCYWKTSPGRIVEWGGERSYDLSEFARYQAECACDTHSRIAQPEFVDAAQGDYRQRADSPCAEQGMRLDIKNDSR